MIKFRYLVLSIILSFTFLFGIYLSSSHSNLPINIKYLINKSINKLNSKSISFDKEPTEVTLSLISDKKDLNNFKFKKILEKDSLTLSILNNNENNDIKAISDIELNLSKDSTYATNLKLGEFPILLAKIDSNNIDKDFFNNLNSIASYTKKNNSITILYLDSVNSIPKNILKYITSLGVDIIITSSYSNEYIELIDNSLILYKDSLIDENFIPQLKLVYFDNICASIGVRFVTEYTDTNKISQKLEEINEKSINLPFFIKESYNFIDILE